MVSKLYKIFSDKRWTSMEGHPIVFENFCILLSNLTIGQKSLIFELIERYTWISFQDYQIRLTEVLKSVEKEKIDSYKKIYLFPVMRPEHENITKSGHTILYMINAMLPLLPEYKLTSFQNIESYELINEKNLKLKDGECIMLLDDYLGSGETIQATIDEILKNTYVKSKDLNVISIAAQKSTIEIIRNNNISIYNSHIVDRGLSDHYLSPVLDENIKIMLDIEKMIPGGSHFSLGYNQSEALITMLKTPDNTFPIFWKSYRRGGEVFEAPFARPKIT